MLTYGGERTAAALLESERFVEVPDQPRCADLSGATTRSRERIGDPIAATSNRDQHRGAQRADLSGPHAARVFASAVFGLFAWTAPTWF